jgi:hypothetical protein
MKNLTLKQGDLVQITESDLPIRDAGLSVGQVCQVETMPIDQETETPSEVLILRGPSGVVPLTWPNGDLTHSTDYMRLLFKCPVVLTKGLRGVSK